MYAPEELQAPIENACSSCLVEPIRSECYRPVAHARGRSKCRQECCERGYYNLHRQLNQSLVLHSAQHLTTNIHYGSGCGTRPCWLIFVRFW